MTWELLDLAQQAGLRNAQVKPLLDEVLAPPFGSVPDGAWAEFVQACAKLEAGLLSTQAEALAKTKEQEPDTATPKHCDNRSE